MKLRVLKNIIKQGFQGVWRNRGMSGVSVLSIGIVLMILGLVLILALSVNKLATDTNKMIDQIDVFISDDLDVEEIKALSDKIVSIGGIKSIKFKSRDEGLKELKASWEDNAWLLDGYDEKNPLPNSFVVRINDINDAKTITKRIGDIDGVIMVNFFADEIDQMLKISKYIKIGGLAVVVFLTIISIFLISNTIKLAVNSRQEEISIMKWVGATNGYIKGPFFIEGVFLGLIASVIAAGIMCLMYKYFYTTGTVDISPMLLSALVKPELIYQDLFIIFITLGVGIGALGSLISLKKFLKV